MISNLPVQYAIRLRTLQAVVMICILFIGMTVAAMVVYPGGTATDNTTSGYEFIGNFFSELGMTHTYSGQANTTSYVLFTSALTFAGLGLGAFFMVFAAFFTRSSIDQFLAWSGTFFGLIAGSAFIGIAFTPIDVNLDFHNELVQLAFRAFLIAVVLYLLPLFRERRRPHPSPWVFFIFAALLGGYILLITFGPGLSTPEGIMVQSLGQKIIVYAGIISILLESLGGIVFFYESGRF
jgi:hypothetical protein